MSFSTVEIGSSRIVFDKERTKAHRTEFNSPCECAYCKSYYKHIEGKAELVEFLNRFGIDIVRAEEIFSLDIDEKTGLFQYEGYYGVFGRIEGEESELDVCGVKVRFLRNAIAPTDRIGEYFWICLEGVLACEKDIN